MIHPAWLAMTNGRHRFAPWNGVCSIHSRLAAPGSMTQPFVGPTSYAVSS